MGGTEGVGEAQREVRRRGAVVCQRMSAGTNCGEPSPRGCPPPARHLLTRGSVLPHSQPCASCSNPYAVCARSLSTTRRLGSASLCALERARGVARFRGLQLQSLPSEKLKISLSYVPCGSCTTASTNRATSLRRRYPPHAGNSDCSVTARCSPARAPKTTRFEAALAPRPSALAEGQGSAR